MAIRSLSRSPSLSLSLCSFDRKYKNEAGILLSILGRISFFRSLSLLSSLSLSFSSLSFFSGLVCYSYLLYSQFLNQMSLSSPHFSSVWFDIFLLPPFPLSPAIQHLLSPASSFIPFPHSPWANPINGVTGVSIDEASLPPPVFTCGEMRSMAERHIPQRIEGEREGGKGERINK